MDKDICRAITFINYHIPPVLDADMKAPYITLGFFDGMLTESLDVLCEEDELKCLWRYSIKRMDSQLGQYSYQNIFCFGRDGWNSCSDELFWDENTNREYPLTFIVFLQLREYMQGEDAFELQCKAFNRAAYECIGQEGLCYTYNTIDKNDFVVCLKCREYQTAVNAIKNLHRTGVEIIYSYSVFSISRIVLTELQDARYRYIFEEEIFSICMKGITNSYDLRNQVTLDQKYNEYCRKLIDKLYEGQADEQKDFKIYDILGDNDFRLIARHVNLGKLLLQFAPGGLLCYEEGEFQFYFFSSNMVLNTLTSKDLGVIDSDYVIDSRKAMEEKFRAPFCERLEKRMSNITRIATDDNACMDERVITFCHALWQLLQSLKPLETAPAKKYDFWSLYIPFSQLVDILEEKLEKACGADASEQQKDFIGNEEIYNFIHKFSMTLHGTLRTDIQFFQIRDFNVIVHYAPAKLRAFYSFWVLRLTDYYNEFNEGGKKNKYSFILSPGMYQQTCVSELYTNYAESQRLILIKVPERHLYSNRWLPVILAHEVSHFVGYASRQRMERHLAWLNICARVLFLEINSYRYHMGKEEWRTALVQGITMLKLYEEMAGGLREEEDAVRKESRLFPHEFHSDNSIKIIKKTFRAGNLRFTSKSISDDSERMNNFLKKAKNIEELPFDQYCQEMQEILSCSGEEYNELLALNRKFESSLMPQLLQILKYVCKETYADLIAVLTLGLSPEDYIFSFIKGECNIAKEQVENENGILLFVRAGLTMRSVMNVAQGRPACLAEDFCTSWSGDVLRELVHKFGEDSIEREIAMHIYGYDTGIRDCNNEIQSYVPIYNYRDGTFSNRLLDFLNDQLVWNCLIGYLGESAKAYVTILSKERPGEMRQKLKNTYDIISKGSVISMSQEIEKFLAEFETEKGGAAE